VTVSQQVVENVCPGRRTLDQQSPGSSPGGAIKRHIGISGAARAHLPVELVTSASCAPLDAMAADAGGLYPQRLPINGAERYACEQDLNPQGPIADPATNPSAHSVVGPTALSLEL
jgi:hypothetical protein